MAALPSSASAAVFLFTITGADNATFIIDDTPTPDLDGGSLFSLFNVAVTVNGIASNATLDFYDMASGGGVDIGGTSVTLAGPQLFSGTTAAPVFSLGNFALTGFFDPSKTYNVAVSDATPPVPEPASWAMLLVGFGFIGGAMRAGKRQQHATLQYL